MLRVLLVVFLGLLLVSCQAAPATPTRGPAPATGGPATATAAPAAGGQSGAGPTVVGGAATGGQKVAVVATFSVLADLVRQVGGDRVDVVVLVGPGQDAHTFQPSPAEGVALARAALVFENGLEFEPWLDELFQASGTNATRVVVTNGLTPLKDEGHGHADEADPHVWHDVKNVLFMTGVIRDALAQSDPAGAPIYQANTARYLAELRELDTWIVDQVAKLPAERRTLVTNHDTFQYFAGRYGFTVVGTALGGASTEAVEPSAGEIAGLVKRVKAAGVPVIFAENVANPKLLEQIAREAGVRLGPTLYTDALSAPGGEADSYVTMVRYNVTAIVGALTP